MDPKKIKKVLVKMGTPKVIKRVPDDTESVHVTVGRPTSIVRFHDPDDKEAEGQILDHIKDQDDAQKEVDAYMKSKADAEAQDHRDAGEVKVQEEAEEVDGDSSNPDFRRRVLSKWGQSGSQRKAAGFKGYM